MALGGERANKATGGMRSRNLQRGEGETTSTPRKRAHSANTGRRRAPVSGEGRTGELRREGAPALARGRRGSDVRKGCILARTGARPSFDGAVSKGKERRPPRRYGWIVTSAPADLLRCAGRGTDHWKNDQDRGTPQQRIPRSDQGDALRRRRVCLLSHSRPSLFGMALCRRSNPVWRYA